MTNKWKYRLIFIIVFTFIWVVINDGIGVHNYFIGVIVSIICLYASSRLLSFDYVDTFSLPLFSVLRYIFFMFYAVYKSGLIASYRILTGRVSPVFLNLDIDPKIQNVLLQHMVGTSITLTPGTITVVNKDRKLKVLCLHHKAGDESPSKQFENLLATMEKTETVNT